MIPIKISSSLRTYVPVLYATIGEKIPSPEKRSGGLYSALVILDEHAAQRMPVPLVVIAAPCDVYESSICVLHVVGNGDYQVVPPYGSRHLRGYEAITCKICVRMAMVRLLLTGKPCLRRHVDVVAGVAISSERDVRLFISIGRIVFVHVIVQWRSKSNPKNERRSNEQQQLHACYFCVPTPYEFRSDTM